MAIQSNVLAVFFDTVSIRLATVDRHGAKNSEPGFFLFIRIISGLYRILRLSFSLRLMWIIQKRIKSFEQKGH